MTINTATATLAELKSATMSDLLDTYNKITGEGIKRFSDHAAAVRRTWKVIGQLGPGENINAAAKKAKAAVKKAVKKVIDKGGKREDYENRIIRVLVKENKKRPGSRAHDKFAILMKNDGKTIKDFKKEEGRHAKLDVEPGWPATELRWALKLELVKIINTPIAKAA